MLSDCQQVHDLTPLKGIKLQVIWLQGTSVTDLTPLQGMELTEVTLTPRSITKGMDVLRQMKSLKTVGVGRPGGLTDKFTSSEFWKKYDAGEFSK
jgi:hypothetical protein